MLNQYLWNTTFITRTKTATDEHVSEHEQEHTKQQGEDVTTWNCNDDEQKRNRTESNQQHSLSLLFLLTNGFLLNTYNAFCTSCRYRAYTRFILIVFVWIDEYILECILGQEVGHRASKHGFTSSRVTNHQHVTALLGRFTNHDRSCFLSNHLVNKTLRNWNILCCFKFDVIDPLINTR